MNSLNESNEVLAAQGWIRTDAPITATAQQTFDASRSRIWEVLTDFEQWPEWIEAVSEIDTEGEIAPKTTFTWKANGLIITS